MREIKKWFERRCWTLPVRKQFLSDFLKTEIGKRVLSELVLYANLGVDAFQLGGGDPNKVAYHCGRQSIVQHLLDVAELTERELSP